MGTKRLSFPVNSNTRYFDMRGYPTEERRQRINRTLSELDNIEGASNIIDVEFTQIGGINIDGNWVATLDMSKFEDTTNHLIGHRDHFLVTRAGTQYTADQFNFPVSTDAETKAEHLLVLNEQGILYSEGRETLLNVRWADSAGPILGRFTGLAIDDNNKLWMIDRDFRIYNQARGFNVPGPWSGGIVRVDSFVVNNSRTAGLTYLNGHANEQNSVNTYHNSHGLHFYNGNLYAASVATGTLLPATSSAEGNVTRFLAALNAENQVKIVESLSERATKVEKVASILPQELIDTLENRGNSITYSQTIEQTVIRQFDNQTATEGLIAGIQVRDQGRIVNFAEQQQEKRSKVTKLETASSVTSQGVGELGQAFQRIFEDYSKHSAFAGSTELERLQATVRTFNAVSSSRARPTRAVLDGSTIRFYEGATSAELVLGGVAGAGVALIGAAAAIGGAFVGGITSGGGVVFGAQVGASGVSGVIGVGGTAVGSGAAGVAGGIGTVAGAGLAGGAAGSQIGLLDFNTENLNLSDLSKNVSSITVSDQNIKEGTLITNDRATQIEQSIIAVADIAVGEGLDFEVETTTRTEVQEQQIREQQISEAELNQLYINQLANLRTEDEIDQTVRGGGRSGQNVPGLQVDYTTITGQNVLNYLWNRFIIGGKKPPKPQPRVGWIQRINTTTNAITTIQTGIGDVWKMTNIGSTIYATRLSGNENTPIRVSQVIKFSATTANDPFKVVATGFNNAWSIAVYNNKLLVSDFGWIYEVDPTTGSRSLFYTGSAFISDMKVIGHTLYFSDNVLGQINKMDLRNRQVVPIVQGLVAPESIAIKGNNLYVTDDSGQERSVTKIDISLHNTSAAIYHYDIVKDVWETGTSAAKGSKNMRIGIKTGKNTNRSGTPKQGDQFQINDTGTVYTVSTYTASNHDITFSPGLENAVSSTSKQSITFAQERFPQGIAELRGEIYALYEDAVRKIFYDGNIQILPTYDATKNEHQKFNNILVEPSGLLSDGTNLYATAGTKLYTFDVRMNPVARSGTLASKMRDITYHNSKAYGLGTDYNLYTIDLSTGATTLVGSTGLTAPGSSDRVLIPDGNYTLHSDGTKLVIQTTESKWDVNATTGAASGRKRIYITGQTARLTTSAFLPLNRKYVPTNRQIGDIVIRGEDIIGSLLTVQVEKANLVTVVKPKYQWLRNNVVIPGATKPFYRLEDRDAGAIIDCNVSTAFYSFNADNPIRLIDAKIHRNDNVYSRGGLNGAFGWKHSVSNTGLVEPETDEGLFAAPIYIQKSRTDKITLKTATTKYKRVQTYPNAAYNTVTQTTEVTEVTTQLPADSSNANLDRTPPDLESVFEIQRFSNGNGAALWTTRANKDVEWSDVSLRINNVLVTNYAETDYSVTENIKDRIRQYFIPLTAAQLTQTVSAVIKATDYLGDTYNDGDQTTNPPTPPSRTKRAGNTNTITTAVTYTTTSNVDARYAVTLGIREQPNVIRMYLTANTNNAVVQDAPESFVITLNGVPFNMTRQSTVFSGGRAVEYRPTVTNDNGTTSERTLSTNELQQSSNLTFGTQPGQDYFVEYYQSPNYLVFSRDVRIQRDGDTISAELLVPFGSTGTATYQWTRDGVDITGATSRTYTVVTADHGKTINVKVNGISFEGETLPELIANPILVAAADWVIGASQIIENTNVGTEDWGFRTTTTGQQPSAGIDNFTPIVNGPEITLKNVGSTNATVSYPIALWLHGDTSHSLGVEIPGLADSASTGIPHNTLPTLQLDINGMKHTLQFNGSRGNATAPNTPRFSSPNNGDADNLTSLFKGTTRTQDVRISIVNDDYYIPNSYNHNEADINRPALSVTKGARNAATRQTTFTVTGDENNLIWKAATITDSANVNGTLSAPVTSTVTGTLKNGTSGMVSRAVYTYTEPATTDGGDVIIRFNATDRSLNPSTGGESQIVVRDNKAPVITVTATAIPNTRNYRIVATSDEAVTWNTPTVIGGGTVTQVGSSTVQRIEYTYMSTTAGGNISITFTASDVVPTGQTANTGSGVATFNVPEVDNLAPNRTALTVMLDSSRFIVITATYNENISSSVIGTVRVGGILIAMQAASISNTIVTYRSSTAIPDNTSGQLTFTGLTATDGSGNTSTAATNLNLVSQLNVPAQVPVFESMVGQISNTRRLTVTATFDKNITSAAIGTVTVGGTNVPMNAPVISGRTAIFNSTATSIPDNVSGAVAYTNVTGTNSAGTSTPASGTIANFTVPAGVLKSFTVPSASWNVATAAGTRQIRGVKSSTWRTINDAPFDGRGTVNYRMRANNIPLNFTLFGYPGFTAIFVLQHIVGNDGQPLPGGSQDPNLNQNLTLRVSGHSNAATNKSYTFRKVGSWDSSAAPRRGSWRLISNQGTDATRLAMASTTPVTVTIENTGAGAFMGIIPTPTS